MDAEVELKAIKTEKDAVKFFENPAVWCVQVLGFKNKVAGALVFKKTGDKK